MHACASSWSSCEDAITRICSWTPSWCLTSAQICCQNQQNCSRPAESSSSSLTTATQWRSTTSTRSRFLRSSCMSCCSSGTCAFWSLVHDFSPQTVIICYKAQISGSLKSLLPSEVSSSFLKQISTCKARNKQYHLIGFHSEYAVYASWKSPEIFLCFIIFDRRGCWWLSRVCRPPLCWTSLASALQSSLFSAPASPAQMWVFLQSHRIVFIFRRNWTSEKMEITQRSGLMFTCEWPADSNLCPGRYYWLPWHCNIRLKQVQGLARQIVLKQHKPYGAVMNFTACNDQKQTCFAPLCTTALYISITQSISSPRCSHFWLKNFTFSFFLFFIVTSLKMVQTLVTFVTLAMWTHKNVGYDCQRPNGH